MNLPPLPLIDGCLFIDNSFIELLDTCPRALEYNRLLKRIGAGENAALNFGTAIHGALEYRYRHYRNAAPDYLLEEEQTKLLADYFDKHPCPEDDWRNLNWCIEVVKKYNERYGIEPFNLLLDKDGIPLVELSFALPLYNQIDQYGDTIKVIYIGRIDLPIMIEGQIWIMDHKTTSYLGDQFFNEQRMSAQHRGYSWAFEQSTGMKVTGFMINAIRSKEPPKYVLAGNEKDFRGKRLTPQQWWKESLQRERVYLNDFDLSYWKNNLIYKVQRFFHDYQQDYFPMQTKWCAMYGKCQYYDVCSLEPSSRGVMLSSGNFTDNIWTPLKQPEKQSTNETEHTHITKEARPEVDTPHRPTGSGEDNTSSTIP